MLRWLPVSTLAACGFSVAPAVDPPVDADLDALGTEPGMPTDTTPIDAPVMSVTCHGMFKTVCIGIVPTALLDISGGSTLVVNTDGQGPCLAPAAGSTIPSACILAAATIVINGTIRATGTRPLILLATTSLTINGSGLVDVASRGSERGAGSRTGCPGGGPGGNAGGNGGSFRARGGQGGSGGVGTPGSQQPISALDLGGGCDGYAGGGIAADQGVGGIGGGAVLVISPAISVNGRITASGGGGGGGLLAAAGGGGGGAGGAIVLDTQDLTFNGGGLLFAQGGGGGEGASVSTAGAPGADVVSAGTPALGGRGVNSQGGDGGDGGVSGDGSNGGSGSQGGGGGGGGAGHVRTTDTNANNNGQSYPPIQSS